MRYRIIVCRKVRLWCALVYQNSDRIALLVILSLNIHAGTWFIQIEYATSTLLFHNTV